MGEKTKELKEIQDRIHTIMYEMVSSFKDEPQTNLITMNLTTVSKELNNMINTSIVGNLTERGE